MPPICPSRHMGYRFACQVTFWDYATAAFVLANEYEASGAVATIAFSPDGSTMLAGHSNGCLRLWDVATRAFRDVAMVEPGSPVVAACFSRDGSTFAVESTTNVMTFSGRGELRNKLSTHWLSTASCAKFSADSLKLAIGHGDPLSGIDNQVAVLDMVSGDFVDSVRTAAPVVKLCFSLDRLFLVAALAGVDGEVAVVALAACQVFKTVRVGRAIRSVGVSMSGTAVAAVTDDDSIVLASVRDEVAGGDGVVEQLRASEGPIHAVAFSADGCRLAVAESRAVSVFEQAGTFPCPSGPSWTPMLLLSTTRPLSFTHAAIDGVAASSETMTLLRQHGAGLGRRRGVDSTGVGAGLPVDRVQSGSGGERGGAEGDYGGGSGSRDSRYRGSPNRRGVVRTSGVADSDGVKTNRDAGRAVDAVALPSRDRAAVGGGGGGVRRNGGHGHAIGRVKGSGDFDAVKHGGNRRRVVPDVDTGRQQVRVVQAGYTGTP